MDTLELAGQQKNYIPQLFADTGYRPENLQKKKKERKSVLSARLDDIENIND